MVGLVVWLVAACTLLIPSAAAAGGAYDMGVSYLIDTYNFSSPQSRESLSTFYNSANGRWISQVFSQFQANINSTVIGPTSGTPSDADVRAGIATAHSIGLKVLLKVHVDLYADPDHWRGEIGTFFNASDWKLWFESYLPFITHYASLAQSSGVDKFCVGTELSIASAQTEHWRRVIRAVRRHYSGPLVFAANWDTIDLPWWDDLDFIGVDAYFPLTQVADPTKQQLAAAWDQYTPHLANLSAHFNHKPIMFTEIGYCSDAGANTAPYGCPEPIRLDLSEQANDYAAVFDNVATHFDWFAGVFWWAWSTNPTAGGLSDAGYSMQNKPSQQVLANYYGEQLADYDS